MAIQWFPGHMHLTRKAIGERIKDIDVVIEMLDARLPGSSANPMLADLIEGKPALKILSKQDLADPVQTAAWLAHYNALPGVSALGMDTSVVSPAKALIDASRQLAPNRGGMVKPMRVLICGIPNVGKSTLINTLKGKRAAKTGDEAGVTNTEQRITTAEPTDDLPLIRRLATQATLLKLNDGEAARLCAGNPAASDVESHARFLATETGCVRVVITAAARGAGLLGRDGRWHWEPGRPVAVADTVGAGDAFLAALLSGLLRGRDDAAALAHACRVGEWVATQRGATPDYAAGAPAP